MRATIEEIRTLPAAREGAPMSLEHDSCGFADIAGGFNSEPMIEETDPTAGHPERVIIGDDNYLMRAGIRALLEAAGMEILAEAADTPSLLEQVRHLQPDVIILDPHIHGTPENTLIEALRQQAPRARMLVLSEVVGTDAVRAAFDAGASAYITKHDDLVDLPGVLRTIVSGGTYVSQRVSHSLLENHAAHDRTCGGRRSSLTHRQAEILKLIAHGETTRTISAQLGITPRTVHTHRSRIMQKLNVHTEGALVYSAFKLGLVSV